MIQLDRDIINLDRDIIQLHLDIICAAIGWNYIAT